jgi:nucleotide-binding universal stress UspA family protein
VVGSTHRGRIGRVYPGSVGERLVGHAPCPVAVAPRGLAGRDFTFGTIVVGFDGSETAGAALRTATKYAERTGAALRIVSVVDTDLALATSGAIDNFEQRVERSLEDAVERTRQSVAEVEGRLLYGAPSQAIVGSVEDADLLVLGVRGHHGAARGLLFGSTVSQVLRMVSCPTLIAPTT